MSCMHSPALILALRPRRNSKAAQALQRTFNIKCAKIRSACLGAASLACNSLMLLIRSSSLDTAHLMRPYVIRHSSHGGLPPRAASPMRAVLCPNALRCAAAA